MVTSALRVMFFGTPEFAVPTLVQLLASRHHVVGVVTQPDRPRGRGQRVSPSAVKVVALEHGLPVWHPLTLGTNDFLDTVRASQADIGVVVAYGRLLPQVLLDAPPLGFVNVHASLLPRWRGAAPIHRAVMSGDAVTGVTIMRVVLALDAGPMLATAVTAISASDTSETLEARLGPMGAGLLVNTLDALAAGAAHETPQDERLVTYASKLERAESRVDWTQPATAIDRQIRGLQPWPLAVAHLNDRALGLLQATPLPHASTSAPGTITLLTRDAIHVACGEGTLAISQVKPEGRRPMPVRDFLNGANLTPGLALL